MLFFPKKSTRFSFGGQTEYKQISLILQIVGFRLCKSLFAVVLYLLAQSLWDFNRKLESFTTLFKPCKT